MNIVGIAAATEGAGLIGFLFEAMPAARGEAPLREEGEAGESMDLFRSELAAALSIIPVAPAAEAPPITFDLAGAPVVDAPADEAPMGAPLPALVRVIVESTPAEIPAETLTAAPRTPDADLMTLTRHPSEATAPGKLSFAARVFSIAPPTVVAAPAEVAIPETMPSAPLAKAPPAGTPPTVEIPAAKPVPESKTTTSGNPDPESPEPHVDPVARVAAVPAVRAVRRPEVSLERPEADSPKTTPPRPEAPSSAPLQAAPQAHAEAPLQERPPETAKPTPSRAHRGDPIRATPAEPVVPLKPSSPVRHVMLDLGRGEETVRVNVFDRGGEVHLSVRAAAETMSASMRRDLGDLVAQVERAGMKAETWTPPVPENDFHDSSRQPGQRDQEQPHGRQRFYEQSGEKKQDPGAPRWVDELDLLMDKTRKESATWQPASIH